MKKLMVVAAAVAVAAALAIPTAASARFTHEGNPVSNAHIHLTGHASFSGGTTCSNATATVSQTSATTGDATFSVPNPAECVVTGTLAALGCTELVEATSEEDPWVGHTNTETITITSIKLKNHYKGGAFCPKAVTISGDVVATPDNAAAVSTVTLSGTLTSSLGTNVTVSGDMNVVGGDAGTYGI